MVPIVTIIGSSGSGKTIFIEKLIRQLKLSELRIGALKHTSHTFDIDSPGKDSFRLKESGSDIGGIFSPESFVTIRDLTQDVDVERIIFDHFFDTDLVLIEGFKKSSYPKILVVGSDPEKELASYKKDDLLAVVGDTKISDDIRFFSRYDIKGVAAFLKGEFIEKNKGDNIDLFVNSRHIRLNDYLRKLLKNLMTGILKSLKGVEGEIKEISVKYRK